MRSRWTAGGRWLAALCLAACDDGGEPRAVERVDGSASGGSGGVAADARPLADALIGRDLAPRDAHSIDAGAPDGRVPDGGGASDAAVRDGAAPHHDGTHSDEDGSNPGRDGSHSSPDGAQPLPDASTPPLDGSQSPLDGSPAPDASPPDAAPPGPDAALPPGDGPLAPRVPNRTCRLPDAPPLGDFELVEAFPALDFSRPLWVGTPPGDPDTLVVAEQGGAIWAFDDRDDVQARDEMLRLAVNREGNEEGLLGLAFHPDYAENGRVFIYYTADEATCPGGAGRCSVVSEFRRSERRRIDPASESTLLVVPQPYSNHNGGDLQFGPDGRLYVALGDGGSAGDPLRAGQDTNTLLGKILRLDVDAEPMARPEPPPAVCEETCRSAADDECDDGAARSLFDACPYGTDCADCGPRPSPEVHPPRYAIPPDNPFADGRDGRPEIWTWGMRNPWRMRFDAATGALWVGDVGQDRFEEVDVVTGPGNFGWNVREGFVCYRAQQCQREGLIDPIWAYDHGQGQSITGGLVYRGDELPELWGAYIFADYGSGRVWSLHARPGQMPDVRVLAAGGEITSFGEDARGRPYLTSFRRNVSLLTLRRRQGDAGEPIPQRLSDSGCFADTARHAVAPGVVPFDVNVALWSDGAAKHRYIALPGATRIGYRADGAWELPVGTVLIKTFELAGRRLETRLLARQTQGWRGFTWRWNEAQTDAFLLDGAQDERVDTPQGPVDWHYPSRVECDRCHTAAAGFTLGWRTSQIHREVDYPGGRSSQVAALADAGYLEGVPADVAGLVVHPPLDSAAPLADRARALLDVNCAPCHQPEGPANARIDLRSGTPLASTGMCAAPTQGDLGIAGAHLLSPGDPGRSVILARVGRRGPGQMPPLATSRVDEAGLELLRRWITEAACD